MKRSSQTTSAFGSFYYGVISAVTFLTLLISNVPAEIIPGQMISWTDFSYITCIAIGTEYDYLGTTEGILRYNRYNMRWDKPITVSDGMVGKMVRRIAVSPNDDWITVETESGIYSYQFGADYWYLEAEFPAGLEQDSRPVLPLPDLMLPFEYHLSGRGIISDNLLRDWPITAWLDDHYQSIMIGTWGLGVLRADNRTLYTELIPCGLLQKRVDAIYIEGDSIWLGGNQGLYDNNTERRYGVTLFDRQAKKFRHIEPRFDTGFRSEKIFDIDADIENIYFAGQHGLTVCLREDSNRCVTLDHRDGLPDNQVTALAVGVDTVWVGTAMGLALYDPHADTVHVISRSILGGLFITDLLLHGNMLFIGTGEGTYYINTETKTVGRLKEPRSAHLSDSAKDPFSILDGEIRNLHLYDSVLFVAADRGLIAVDLVAEKITAKNQIIEPVYACAANDIYLAAAIENALLLINRETGRQRRFTESDGLLSPNINAIVVEGDYLWLGSEEGLTRFKWVNPDRVD